MKVHKTIRRGAWIARVVSTCHTQYAVQLDHPSGYRSSWPVQYNDGKIGYDWDNPPRDARRATEAAYHWVKLLT